MITKLFFLLSESFRALFRAKLSAFISSLTIAIALLVFSIAYFTYVNLLGYSYEFKSQYQIEVFFNSDVFDSKASEVFNSILLLDGIEKGELIDKEKAAILFESYFHEKIDQIIGDNPLPVGGKFDIRQGHQNSIEMDKIIKKINAIEGVDVASYQQGVVSKIDRIIENILGFSIAFGITIFVIAVILVSNTIRLIIHSKKEVIETLRLLGATNSFIRLPFVFEGLIQGLLGAVISLMILYLFGSLERYLFESIIELPFVQPRFLVEGNIFFGLLLALIGSSRGISKYLN